MRLSFLVGAGAVTGSKYLLESGRTRLLIDCGLCQGVKSRRNLNGRALEIEPATIDAKKSLQRLRAVPYGSQSAHADQP